jgi:hypothetical protein
VKFLRRQRRVHWEDEKEPRPGVSQDREEHK